MSCSKIVVESESEHMFCASCGIGENDDIKLKTCTACKSVRYCSVTCQKEHRPQHKRACKKKAAELRDALLFKQPESNQFGDCPICLLPHPIDPEKSSMSSCCSKVICGGCNYANQVREVREGKLEVTCPFCRHPLPDNVADINRNTTKRIEANDPAAICMMGFLRSEEGDYQGAFDYWTKAAELGDAADVHYQLSCLYHEGKCVEKDTKKEVYHLEQAAIGGHAVARYNLGSEEWKNGRIERAIKHWIIAAKLGDDQSVEALKDCFRDGFISKDVFAEALRAHQAAVDATKSPQRDEAEAAMQKMEAEKVAGQN